MSTDPLDVQLELDRHHQAVEALLGRIEHHLANLVDVLSELVPERRKG